jgi:hypothetical protein
LTIEKIKKLRKSVKKLNLFVLEAVKADQVDQKVKNHPLLLKK